jgi:hypothetical protein
MLPVTFVATPNCRGWLRTRFAGRRLVRTFVSARASPPSIRAGGFAMLPDRGATTPAGKGMTDGRRSRSRPKSPGNGRSTV